VHAPAADTAAVVTYAAISVTSATAAVGNQPVPQGLVVPQTESHVITGFIATCSAAALVAAATAPTVKIEDGSGNKVFEAYLEPVPDGKTDASGQYLYKLDFRFPRPMRGTAGRALIITMPANGSNTINKLTVLGHSIETA
jgi:hypothetical protein